MSGESFERTTERQPARGRIEADRTLQMQGGIPWMAGYGFQDRRLKQSARQLDEISLGAGAGGVRTFAERRSPWAVDSHGRDSQPSMMSWLWPSRGRNSKADGSRFRG
jgi:hypothetical protein